MPDDTSKPGQAQSGYGQMSPENVSSEFNKHDFHIKQKISRISTNKLVKVLAVYDGDGEKVDAEDTGKVGKTGFVDVQILVNQVDGIGNVMPHGTIYKVPYSRAQGGSNGIVIDPQVGDIGVMACSDRDISSVIENRDVANPGSFRQNSAADGMYVGGSLNGEVTNFIRFTGKGIIINDKNGNIFTLDDQGFTLLDKSGNKYTSDETGVTIKAPLITLDGNVMVTGGMSGNTGAPGSVVDLLHHTHPQPNDSHGDTEADTGQPIGT